MADATQQLWGFGKCKYCHIQMPIQPLRSGVNKAGQPYIKCISQCTQCGYRVIEQVPYEKAITVADPSCFPSREEIIAHAQAS